MDRKNGCDGGDDEARRDTSTEECSCCCCCTKRIWRTRETCGREETSHGACKCTRLEKCKEENEACEDQENGKGREEKEKEETRERERETESDRE